MTAAPLLAALLAQASAGTEAPPNVVVVFVDDLGWADFSCFHDSDDVTPAIAAREAAARTPNIDALAAGGIRFGRFYVNAPICSPSRAALTTGLYPQRVRVTSYLDDRKNNVRRGTGDWLDPAFPALPRLLKNAGYRTGHFGKWHLGGQRDVGEAPLIPAYGFNATLTNFEGLGPRVLPLLNAHDGSEPRKHFGDSADLGRGPVRFLNRDQVTAAFADRAVEFVDTAAAAGRPFYLNLWPDDVHTPLFPPAAERGDGSKADRYRGVLENMDDQLGPLFDRVRNDPELNRNTLILVCSDNGPEPGAGSAGPLRGSKAMLYEGGVRSPLIAWGPGLLGPSAAGTFDAESTFAAFDLVPTILELAGVAPPAGVNFDGEPLADVLTGRSRRSRSAPLFFRRPPDRDRFGGVADLPDLAVIEPGGRWKLLCEYDGSAAELYDLTADPGETTDRAAEHPAVASELTAAVMNWHAKMPPDRGPDLAVPAP